MDLQIRKNKFFFVLFSIWSLIFPLFDCLASEGNCKTGFVTLKVSNVPLGEVLEKISQATACKIVIDEKWADLPVTVALSDATAQEAVKKTLRRMGFSNYGVIIEAHEPTIRVLACSDASGGRHGKGEDQVYEISDEQGNNIEQDQTDFSEPPPDGSDSDASNSAPLGDLSDMEVIPPDHTGEAGVTQSELEALQTVEGGSDMRDVEVIPPENPGEKGLTQKEVDAMSPIPESVELQTGEPIPPEDRL